MGGQVKGKVLYKQFVKKFLSQLCLLKAKEDEMLAMRVEARKVKSELSEVQRTLAEKEKVQAEYEKNLEQANKTASSARELRREMQFAKVTLFLKFCHLFSN